MTPRATLGTAPAAIDIRNVSKSYAQGALAAVTGVSLRISAGQLVALLGPSGSGKTTLLRILAGLEFPDAGVVHFNGVNVTACPARLRGVGFVFQSYALFRHLTVADNIAFPLRVRRRPRREIRERVDELLALMQLEGLGGRRVTQVSGGQAQRVALARALAPHPALLLLDEPFGALDTEVRQELRQWLRRLHDELRVTSVLVTHDQDEALAIADLVAVLRGGQLERAATPAEITARPASAFVERFLATTRNGTRFTAAGRRLEIGHAEPPH